MIRPAGIALEQLSDCISNYEEDMAGTIFAVF